MMNDVQFDILDELYFVISFDDLLKSLDLESEVLLENLKEMVKKGWVKCFEIETELESSSISFDDSKFKNYFFLATKKGLFVHNTT